MTATGTDIARKIAEHKPKFSRKEKAANKEAVKQLAAVHMEKAISKLGEIMSAKDSPANAKVAAANSLIDRIAGKPRFQDQQEAEKDQFDRMSESQLLEMICSTIAGLSQESRNTIAETLLYSQRGLALPDSFVDPDFSETAALRAEEEEERASTGLPPLTPAKPRREPRR